MNWVKQKYDILLLALATLLVVSNAGWIAMSRMEPKNIQAGPSAPKDNSIPPVNLDAIRQAEALAKAPAKWKSPADLPEGSPERGSLLVSRRYLLKDGQLIDPIAEGSLQLHPPITNEWLLAYGLDYTDMTIKAKDSDGDGFSNLEEFNSKTDPTDPKKTPPSMNKLKLVSFKSVPFLLTFKSLSKEEVILKKENNKDKSSSKKALIKFNPVDWNADNKGLSKYFKEIKESYKNEILKLEEKVTELTVKVNKLTEGLEKRKNDQQLSKDRTSCLDQLSKLSKSIQDINETLDLLIEIFPENIKENISITKISPSPKNPEVIEFENNGIRAVLEFNREFQINFKSAEKNALTQYRKPGEQIEGAHYKILMYEAKPGPNGVNASGDLSELIVQNTETGESITLIYNKEANDPTSFGTFRNLLPGADQDLVLKKGEEFTLKPDNRKLKLIDISATKAQIRDSTTGDVFSVLPINASSP